MLLGTYTPTLIGKNRLVLPMKLRKEISGNQLVLSVGMEKCIFGFEEQKWETVTLVDLSRPISDSEGRDLRRKLCMNAEKIELDTQGRLVVPELMMKYAEIEENLIILGAGDHFEIWNTTTWNNYKQEIDK